VIYSRDSNQPAIVAALRQVGAHVIVMTQARRHELHCDLVVLAGGKVYFMEVKRPGHENELTPAERQFALDAAVRGVNVYVPTCVEDALKVIGVI